MPALREIFADFGIQFDRSRALKRGERQVDRTTASLNRMDKRTKKVSQSARVMDSAIGSVTNAVKGLGAALGIAAIAQGFRTIIEGTITSTREIERWSARLGMSEEALFSWSRVAARFGGDVDDVTDVFKELQIKTRDAVGGAGVAGDAWKMLGINVRDLTPILNDQEALMETFINGLNGVDEATRNFVIDDIMSDAGTRLTEMFEVGVPGLREMRDEVRELGGRQFPQLARATRDYTMAGARLNDTWIAARNALATQLLPLLTAGAERLRELVTTVRTVIETSNILETTLIAVGAAAAAAGVAAAVAWGPAIATVLAVAAGVAALILVSEDLTMFMNQEGDTVTEHFLRWRLGIEDTTFAARALLIVFQAIEEIVGTVMDVLTVLQTLSPQGLLRIALGGDTTAPLSERATRYYRWATGEASRTGESSSIGTVQGSASDIATARQTLRDRDLESIFGIDAPTTFFDDVRAPRMSIPPPMDGAPRGNVGINRINAAMEVNVTVNEATDAASVQQQVETAVRRAGEEQRSEMARDMWDLVTDNEQTLLEGA